MNNADKNSNGVKKPPILRVADIIPPYHNDLIQESQKQKTNNGLQNNQGAQEHKSAGANNYEIPKFDIAHQILTQQRKCSAMKRKAPGEQSGERTQEQSDTGEQEYKRTRNTEYRTPAFAEAAAIRQDIIVIKEIVRRDIERLCQNNFVYK